MYFSILILTYWLHLLLLLVLCIAITRQLLWYRCHDYTGRHRIGYCSLIIVLPVLLNSAYYLLGHVDANINNKQNILAITCQSCRTVVPLSLLLVLHPWRGSQQHHHCSSHTDNMLAPSHHCSRLCLQFWLLWRCWPCYSHIRLTSSVWCM